MPTNRTKRTRKFKPSGISPAMRYYLETGDYGLREFHCLPREKVEIFRLGNPACRDRVCELWEKYRKEILRNWRQPGRPWAEEIFDNENS